MKNEENFIYYSLKSVINYVEQIIVFDTGSTDRTVEIVKSLMEEYPGKILFEEKGLCDKERHTILRQEMIEKTKTSWFMILDGDEIWSSGGMLEILKNTSDTASSIECLIAPFYLCVGDIFHRYYKRGSIQILGKKDFFYPRVFKLTQGIKWHGNYGLDFLVNDNEEEFFNNSNSLFLKNKYWHVTHLVRSSISNDYSSGGLRSDKEIRTYFLIGRKINEKVPNVFNDKLRSFRLSSLKSFVNFFTFLKKNLLKRFLIR